MVVGRRAFVLIIGSLLLTLASPGAAAEATRAREEGQRQVLVIYSDTSTLSANIGIAAGLRDVMNGTLTRRYQILTEFRSSQQFPDAEADAAFVEMLTRKYRDRPIALVITIGPRALEVTLKNRERFAAGVPVVAGGVLEQSIPNPRPADLFAAVGSFELEATVALAKRLQPEARRLVIFTGSAQFDLAWRATARDTLADESGIEVAYVTDRTLAEFEAEAAALDPDTILLILTIFEDASGANFIPAEAAAFIASASSAPSWGVYSTFVGKGVVGGVFETFETIGRTVGNLALAVLEGDMTGDGIVSVASTAVVDWLAMKRFGLDERLVPPSATLLNYDPPVWERYRTELLLVLAVVFAQTVTIAALVFQGRRRHAAEMELAARRLELAQVARVAQLGELSGAITHELNQPLTAIMANAEAGSMLLKKSPPDLEQIASILSDIAADDQRASNTIASLRKLMRRENVDPGPLDLNAVVRAVESLTKSELLMRCVRLVVRTAPGPLTVLGNMEQFQQVVLNLILNGADAMAGQAPETRLLIVETAERADGWRQVAVQDLGPGLDLVVEKDPFRAFVTTKANGMGIGLAICRSIADAHGGTVCFERADNGARVVFALPPA